MFIGEEELGAMKPVRAKVSPVWYVIFMEDVDMLEGEELLYFVV